MLSIFIIMFGLTGCKSSALSEEEIAQSFPEGERMIWVDDFNYTLDIESVEIERRNTEDDFDTVYCTMIMGNGNYQKTADYILYYTYYDDAGWYLEDMEVLDFYVEAISGLSKDESDLEMSKYYFDTYTYVDNDFDNTKQTSYTVYKTDYFSTNYSYQGNVILVNTFYPTYTGGTWEKSLVYEDDFTWNVIASWGADPSMISGERFWKTACELEILSIDSENEIIEFSATEYYKDSEYKTESSMKEYYVMDYTGTDYLFVGYRVAADEETKAKLKYNAPTLSFAFEVGSSEYAVRIKPESVDFSAGGFGGIVRGSYMKDQCITSWVDDYGWTQYECAQIG